MAGGRGGEEVGEGVDLTHIVRLVFLVLYWGVGGWVGGGERGGLNELLYSMGGWVG